MIGAMPAVAVRHERRRQEKRLKRPSQLYLAGQWMPPPQGSPPTPSPHGPNLDPMPELYLCGKVSTFTMSTSRTKIITQTIDINFINIIIGMYVCIIILCRYQDCTL